MRLKATDDHEFDAYVAEPAATARAAIVVIQEIFGVNSHIRGIADGYARDGYWAIAPALFDRAERNIQLGYDAEGRKRGMQAASQVGVETAMKDVAATLKYATEKFPETAVLGFCWGGTLAWLAATRLKPSAAVAYYGGQIAKFVSEKPTCPVMLHFGEKDAHIPLSDIDKIRENHPEVQVFLYEAGHGFNCDQRESFEPKSAAVARQRTLEFLTENL
jgi:carboxymethylenebutenolidase